MRTEGTERYMLIVESAEMICRDRVCGVCSV